MKLNYSNYYFPYSFNQFIPVDMQETDIEQVHIQTNNIYMYPENLTNALTIIQQAVSGESEDRAFYTYLSDIAPSEAESRIISGIRDNEISRKNAILGEQNAVQRYRQILFAMQ